MYRSSYRYAIHCYKYTFCLVALFALCFHVALLLEIMSLSVYSLFILIAYCLAIAKLAPTTSKCGYILISLSLSSVYCYVGSSGNMFDRVLHFHGAATYRHRDRIKHCFFFNTGSCFILCFVCVFAMYVLCFHFVFFWCHFCVFRNHTILPRVEDKENTGGVQVVLQECHPLAKQILTYNFNPSQPDKLIEPPTPQPPSSQSGTAGLAKR